MSVVHKPPYPVWREKDGTVGTVCSGCGRYLYGVPPQMCADCLAPIKERKRLARKARKAAKATGGAA